MLLLYSCYHMPHTPQDTLGLPAIKHYNQARITRLESLDWFKIVSKSGEPGRLLTIPNFHEKELQDYVEIMRVRFSTFQK